MTRRPALPPVDVYGLISDGLEGPLRGGSHRGIKHIACNLTQEQIDHVLEQQHRYLMDWFCETFQFPEAT